jgi:hypothetical protein
MSDNDLVALMVAAATFLAPTLMFIRALMKKWSAPTGAPVEGTLQALEQRFARVEVALDDLSAEISRLGEGQQFVTKLLAERARDAVGPAEGRN